MDAHFNRPPMTSGCLKTKPNHKNKKLTDAGAFLSQANTQDIFQPYCQNMSQVYTNDFIYQQI